MEDIFKISGVYDINSVFYHNIEIIWLKNVVNDNYNYCCTSSGFVLVYFNAGEQMDSLNFHISRWYSFNLNYQYVDYVIHIP